MTPVNEDRFTELAADYALGLIEGEELEEFERHLASGCAACERELAAMDAVGDALAYSAAQAPAPAGLRDRVLAAVAADLAAGPTDVPSMFAEVPGHPAAGQALYKGQPTVEPTYEPSPAPWPPKREVAATAAPPWWVRIAPAFALAGLAAAIVAGGFAYRLQGQLALVRADLERVQAENQALARVMSVVASEQLRVVALGGLEAAPGSQGRVLWSPESKQAVLYAYGLPAAPAGRDYQLWVIDGDTPRSEGVFPVDAQGRATHVLPELPAAAGVGAFAVTLEPAGGVPQPTGAMYLLGAVPARDGG